MKKYIIIIILVILSIGIVSASWYTKSEQTNSYERISSVGIYEIIRFHDDVKMVTCWSDISGSLSTSNSITCLPDYMLERSKTYNPNDNP